MAKANDSARSYFEEGRSFKENPLKTFEVIQFYQRWLWAEEGQIKDVHLQALIPVENGFIVHFTRQVAPQYFYMKIIAQDPETLINSPILNSRLNKNDKSQAEQVPASQRDFSKQPLTVKEIQRFYVQNPVKGVSIKEIKDMQSHFLVTFVNDSRMNLQSTKKIDKTNPKTLQFEQQLLKAPLLEYFPDFKQRNFELWPLTLAEVDEIYQNYQGRLSPSVRARYQGVAYDEEGENIILSFKGGLSGKLFYHTVIPTEPNSLLIN